MPKDKNTEAMGVSNINKLIQSPSKKMQDYLPLIRAAIQIDGQHNMPTLKTTDKAGKNFLHKVVEIGNSNITEALLKVMTEDKVLREMLNAQDNSGRTPLHYAAQYGYAAAITELVTRGADVNAQDNYARTPLHLAAKHGYAAAITELITHGANVGAQNLNKDPPLYYAVTRGHLAAVEALMGNPQEIFTHAHRHGVYMPNILDDAIVAGQTEVVKLLVSTYRITSDIKNPQQTADKWKIGEQSFQSPAAAESESKIYAESRKRKGEPKQRNDIQEKRPNQQSPNQQSPNQQP